MENLDAKDLSVILWHETAEELPQIDSFVLGVGEEFDGTPVPYIYHEVNIGDAEVVSQDDASGKTYQFTLWHTLIEGNPKYWAYLPMNNPYSREKQNEPN